MFAVKSFLFLFSLANIIYYTIKFLTILFLTPNLAQFKTEPSSRLLVGTVIFFESLTGKVK